MTIAEAAHELGDYGLRFAILIITFIGGSMLINLVSFVLRRITLLATSLRPLRSSVRRRGCLRVICGRTAERRVYGALSCLTCRDTPLQTPWKRDVLRRRESVRGSGYADESGAVSAGSADESPSERAELRTGMARVRVRTAKDYAPGQGVSDRRRPNNSGRNRVASRNRGDITDGSAGMTDAECNRFGSLGPGESAVIVEGDDIGDDELLTDLDDSFSTFGEKYFKRRKVRKSASDGGSAAPVDTEAVLASRRAKGHIVARGLKVRTGSTVYHGMSAAELSIAVRIRTRRAFRDSILFIGTGIRYLARVMLFVFCLDVAGINFAYIALSLGALAVVALFLLNNIGMDLWSAFKLQWNAEFAHGDVLVFVESPSVTGTIVARNMFVTQIITSDMKIQTIPNSRLASSIVQSWDPRFY